MIIDSIMKNSLAAVLLFSATIANASSWHVLWHVDSVENSYFFDGDTVIKDQDTVQLWLKNVRKNNPDRDGAWATATRYKFNCRNRTVQVLGSTDYDANNNFLKSYSQIGSPMLMPPDSILESVSKVVCNIAFPNDKSDKSDYTKVRDNDIFALTRWIKDVDKAISNKLPK